GRGHKISKEQIVGLVVALEIFVREGDAVYADQLAMAERFLKELRDLPQLEVTIVPNDETFHEHLVVPHVPRVLLQWDAKALGLSAKDLDAAMAQDDPPVFLRSAVYFNYYTNKEWRLIDTFCLRQGEDDIVLERLKKVFSKKH
ncbi:MAG TPA: hypothetical protein VMG58_18620, partial [Candidatus Sulfotelmatobacter sp.]|nr:hypothetical protein [Candidatus Sulfotelmatobacter sp.]